MILLYRLIAVPDNKNGLSYRTLNTSSTVFYYWTTIVHVNDQPQLGSAEKYQFLLNKTSINSSVIKAGTSNMWTKEQREVSVTSLMRFRSSGLFLFLLLIIGSSA